jgi:hypothetical protein
MIDRRFVLSLLLGLVSGSLATMANVAGRHRLWRFRGRPIARVTLIAITFPLGPAAQASYPVADCLRTRTSDCSLHLFCMQR